MVRLVAASLCVVGAVPAPPAGPHPTCCSFLCQRPALHTAAASEMHRWCSASASDHFASHNEHCIARGSAFRGPPHRGHTRGVDMVLVVVTLPVGEGYFVPMTGCLRQMLEGQWELDEWRCLQRWHPSSARRC